MTITDFSVDHIAQDEKLIELSILAKRRIKKMSEWDEFRGELLADPIVRNEYDALEPEFAIIQAMIDARTLTGLTQKQLSERTGIAQGDISRIERGEANPSLRTLKRLAAGMNAKLKIDFIRV